MKVFVAAIAGLTLAVVTGHAVMAYSRLPQALVLSSSPAPIPTPVPDCLDPSKPVWDGHECVARATPAPGGHIAPGGCISKTPVPGCTLVGGITGPRTGGAASQQPDMTGAVSLVVVAGLAALIGRVMRQGVGRGRS